MLRALRVVKPGLRTTVEDQGRRGTGSSGVPRGGAFDAAALAAANALVGNEEDDAGLELTLRAPELEALRDVDVAAVGADFAFEVAGRDAFHAIERGRAVRVPAGARLRGGYASGGARAWLAISGGVDVPFVLGSRSTEASARFGGFEGRALAAGDVLPLGEPRRGPSSARYRDPCAGEGDVALRVLPGPQRDAMPPGFAEALLGTWFAVGRDSDRTGVRLAFIEPAALPPSRPMEIEPEGAVAGAVQVPPDGNPIVLGVDGPTTGGYAKPFVVIRADLGILARLAPSARVRLREVTCDEAADAWSDLQARRKEILGGA